MLGFVAVLMGLAWTFRTSLFPGLSVQWLVAPLALFLLGPRWAVAAVVGAALFAAGVDSFPWSEAPMRALVFGIVPITIAWGVLTLVERRLPAHLFVYLFVAVFAGTLLAVLGAGAVWRWLSASAAAASPDYWIALLILADGEAVTTGFVVTGFALYRPEWLYTFDVERYLRRPGPAG